MLSERPNPTPLRGIGRQGIAVDEGAREVRRLATPIIQGEAM